MYLSFRRLAAATAATAISAIALPLIARATASVAVHAGMCCWSTGCGRADRPPGVLRAAARTGRGRTRSRFGTRAVGSRLSIYLPCLPLRSRFRDRTCRKYQYAALRRTNHPQQRRANRGYTLCSTCWCGGGGLFDWFLFPVATAIIAAHHLHLRHAAASIAVAICGGCFVCVGATLRFRRRGVGLLGRRAVVRTGRDTALGCRRAWGCMALQVCIRIIATCVRPNSWCANQRFLGGGQGVKRRLQCSHPKTSERQNHRIQPTRPTQTARNAA